LFIFAVGSLTLRRFDRSQPVNMTKNERRGEIAAMLSQALCRLGQKSGESARNSDTRPCCGREDKAHGDSLVNNNEIEERVTE